MQTRTLFGGWFLEEEEEPFGALFCVIAARMQAGRQAGRRTGRKSIWTSVPALE